MIKLLFLISFILFLDPPAFSNTPHISEIHELRYEEFNLVKNPKALLVLFDGAPGIAKDIPLETKIPSECIKYGIQCIGINQQELFLADTAYERIKRTIEFCLGKYKVVNNNLLMGGFSLGGYSAIRFTEIAKEKDDTAMIAKAVFGVDPLLDHLEVYRYAEREINRNCANEGSHNYGKPEAVWLKNYYLTTFGLPERDSTIYISRSCYSPNLKDGANAKYLINTPLKLYHEVDLMWYIKERCRDINNQNVKVGSQMINFLYNRGNKNAVITVTLDKGRRSDGRRHPHSWSIADPQETLSWLIQFIN